MDISDLAWLRAVAHGGSLSAAAKARHVSVSTPSRRLDALEATLGVRLLDRGARGVRLTPDGRRIAALADPALDALAAVERAAAAMRTAGGKTVVRVSATDFVVSDVLAPHVGALRAAAPELTVELVGEANIVSLAGREADLAVRMARPAGNSLHAQALPAIALGVFGTADLAGLAGDASLPLLVYDESYGRLPELGWVDALDRPGEIVLRTGNTRALLEAARVGAGAALLPAAFARRAGLVELMRLPEPLSRTPWVTVHRDLRRLPHIRAVAAWVRQAFAKLA